jgi:hypothetical protein
MTQDDLRKEFELPELPEPVGNAIYGGAQRFGYAWAQPVLYGDQQPLGKHLLFTADQMREYGQACASRMVPEWRPVEEAPKDGRQVLATFKGQFGWLQFIAWAGAEGVNAPGYAKPTHWMPLPASPSLPKQQGGNDAP